MLWGWSLGKGRYKNLSITLRILSVYTIVDHNLYFEITTKIVRINIALMEEIPHQLIWKISHYLHGFKIPRRWLFEISQPSTVFLVD